MISASFSSSGNGTGSAVPMDVLGNMKSGSMKVGSPAPSKILIVDDEPDILEEVSECLEEEGFPLVTALNADEARKIVENDTDIGIIITDIRMPGTDGLELARSLIESHGANRDLFVIVVTGHAGMREAIEALQIGAEDFLTKPISPDHLLHSIKRAEEMIHLRSSERAFKQRLKQEVEEKTADVKSLATDLEEKNKELEKKNEELTIVGRLKDEFLMMMSHELNTPMNAIYGFAQLLDQNTTINSDENLQMYVKNILLGTERLTKTVSSILLLSDLTAGRLQPFYSTFTSDELLNCVKTDFPSYTGKTEINFQCVQPEQAFELEADHYQLMKAINMLVDNGVKFGGGKLIFRVAEDELFCHISLSDNGSGMTGNQISAALEPMRQVDGSTGRNAEGVGLGLPLVKGIAELHGGKLDIESAPGKGTTVTISVPKNRLS